jgi:serine/threonine protein kinase
MPKRIGGFDVLRYLVRGGMGVLYEAVSVDVGIHAAIKLLPASSAVQATVLRRFLREQRITQALRHPNIVRCFEVGSHRGRPYIVSEFVGGGTGVDVASSSCPVEDALWLGADLFRALGYAHDLGVVHRDVKPANLLLTRSDAGTDRRAKLADFGLAKSKADLRGTNITLANEAGGSLLTMGPEQVLNFLQVGPGADVYSAAATVFWLLTCDTPLVLPCPLDDASLTTRTTAIISPARRSLADFRPDVPRAVVDLLDSLLTKDSQTRDRLHAKEIASALGVLAGRVARARMPTSTPGRLSVTGRSSKLPSDGQHDQQDETVARDSQAQPDKFELAMKTVEQCIRLFERAVERSAAELREAIESQDAPRVRRAVQNHDLVREDLRAALAQWEELLNLG